LELLDQTIMSTYEHLPVHDMVRLVLAGARLCFRVGRHACAAPATF
jgi:hypothetical protein